MPRLPATVFLLAIVLATPASPQASPYLPLDDPRLPLIEHLITRGDIRDPSPMLRPAGGEGGCGYGELLLEAPTGALVAVSGAAVNPLTLIATIGFTTGGILR